MGKVSRVHPVSLHVIRGAAEYCGWKFKSIKQTTAPGDFMYARYVAEIVIVPIEAQNVAISEMQRQLQNCFMDDIRVHWLRKSKTGRWLCDLTVTAMPKPPVDPEALSELYQSGI